MEILKEKYNTLEYYNKNAKTYYDQTLVGNLQENYDKFLKHLQPNASLESFFRDIGLPYESFILTEAFRSAFFVNKISYDSILAEVHSVCHDKDEQELRLLIQNIFKDWLKNYPELAKRCPKLSVIPLIKLFVKKCHK